MKHLPKVSLLLLGVLWLGPSAVYAQQTIDNTTLSAAMSDTARTLTLAATTCTTCTFGPDILIYVDQEAMRVTGQYVSGSTVPVTRGTDGTRAKVGNHASGAVVLYGPADRFKAVDPTPGACTRSSQQWLPWMNISNGLSWSCDNVNWYATNNYAITNSSRALARNTPIPTTPGQFWTWFATWFKWDVGRS